MHAPLELMARFLLLSRVDPARRGLARLQFAASAKRYGEIGEPLALPRAAEGADGASIDAALAATRAAVVAGDTDRALAAAQALVSHDAHARLVDGLCDLLVSRYSCGAHSHIYLHLFAQLPPAQQQAALPMLLGFVHEVSRHPGQAIGAAIDNVAHNEAAGVIARELEQAQREVPKLGGSTEGGISGLLGKSIDHGLDTTIRSIIADRDDAPQPLDKGFVIPCRTAACSMLQEAEEHARYGWTHALTLPQAVLGLSGRFVDPASALLASNLYASAYQAIIAKGRIVSVEAPPRTDLGFAEALSSSPDLAAAAGWHLAPEARAAAFDLIATEASIRPDCHGVKYALATRQAAEADPQFGHVYLAAAAKLVHLWVAEYPFDQIVPRIKERD